MKTKNTFYNSIASLIYYAVTIILGIFNRKAIIVILGIEYQGINGLFSNVLSMLSIAELGIGTTMIYHLYRPLEQNDSSAIRSLMCFYRKCYIGIAGVILGAGILIIPLLGHLIYDYSLPYAPYSIYIWFLLDSVCSYLFSYKRSILIADQKNHVVVFCDMFYQLGSKIGQIVILLYSHSFICYLSVMVVCRIINNLIICHVVDGRYPYLKKLQGENAAIGNITRYQAKVKGSFFHKIGSFVVLGTDNILISKFLGLASVGIYSNYFLIINSIKNICSQILTAATASVGHLLIEGNDKKTYEVFMQLQILNGFLVNCAATGIYCVATPLIAQIFGEQYVVSGFTLLVLSLNFCVAGMRTVYSVFKEAGGILYEDRFVPVIESAANLLSSLLFLHYFGLAGVFMGTIFSSSILFVYTYPHLVYKGILGRRVAEYWREFLWLGAILLASMAISGYICSHVVLSWQIGQIAFNAIISVGVSNSLFLTLYAFWKPETRILIAKCRTLLAKN